MKLIILTVITSIASLLSASSDSCNINNVIRCDESLTLDKVCYFISPNDSAIQTALRDCTAGNFVTLYLIIQQLSVMYTVNLTMLPDNIQRLSIQGYYGAPVSNDYHARLVTSRVHTSVLNVEVFRMNVDNSWEEKDFFQHFPNMVVARLLYIQFLYHPILQGLSSLETLHFNGYSIACYGSNSKRIDLSLVGGLSSVEELVWYSGCVEYVVPGAFRDLSQLTLLSLGYNLIGENATQVLDRDSFKGLTKLQILELNNNRIVSLDSKVFNGLIDLEEVDLMNNPLVCSCELQWTSIVKNFGIDINGTCSNTDSSMVAVQDSSLYTDCTQLLSYQCLNRDNNCTNVCVDTPSSYVCGCGEGYGLVLGRDTQICEDIDECLYDGDECEQECDNILGSYSCSCHEGFQLESNGRSCVDTDECNTTQHCQHTCDNIVGSYSCSCYAGYILSTDGRTCLDVNECVEDLCAGFCVNTEGSYVCMCDTGFSANSTDCTDVNECDLDNGGCEHFCVNTVGSYVCECLPGYRVDTENVSVCVPTDAVNLFGYYTSPAAVLTTISVACIVIISGSIVLVIMCVVIVCLCRKIADVEREREDIMNTQFTVARRPTDASGVYASIDENYTKFKEQHPGYVSELPTFVSLPRTEIILENSQRDRADSTYFNVAFNSPKGLDIPMQDYHEMSV